jgi:Ser/Thr protein kinase RdoA (MazF antagonist)
MMVSADIFPVVYSTLGKDALITRILGQYNLNRITNLQLWHRGLSDVYLVETNDNKYILRVSHNHWRNLEETNFELELLKFLQQNKLPVAYPIATKHNQFCIEINAPEGKRYAALFIYAPGEIPLGDFNETQSKKLGEILAKLHQIGSNFYTTCQRKPLNLEYLLDESLTIILPFLQENQTDFRYLQETVFNIKNKLKNFPAHPPFWTTCWGDPHSGNTHFTIDTQLTLFDFDQCGYGWRIFDIAKFFQRALNTGMTRKVRKAFIEEYQTIVPLTPLELDLLRYFIQIAHIWMWAISINTAMIHNWCLLDHSYFNKRLQQLKMLACHDCELF